MDDSKIDWFIVLQEIKKNIYASVDKLSNQ